MAEAETAAAPAAMRADLGRAPVGPVLLKDRYQIDPAMALADLDSPSAKAYAVEDRRDTGRKLFALLCNPGLPPRLAVMAELRGNPIKGVLPLVEWGAVDWPPLGRRTLAVVYERPLGGRVADSPAATETRISEHELPKRIIEPLVAALQRMASRNIAHRAIRPNNLFYMDEERQTVVLGDCVTAPPGYDQPLVFETVDRGLADPAGRGEGSIRDDVYALGVSIVFLALSDNPVAKLDADALIRLKVEQGTYGAICGRERVPLPLIEPLRGMLLDEEAERWGLEELSQWIVGKRMTPIQKKASAKADITIDFLGTAHATPRTLAHAFSQNVAEAAKTIKGGALEPWLRRQLNYPGLADAVAESLTLGKAQEAEPTGADDYLVAKVCIFLDRRGPIRYKGLAFMPDGFGPTLALELLHKGDAQIPVEVVLREIPTIWAAAQGGFKPGASPLERNFAELRSHLVNTEIGYGVERCLYESNPGLSCQSPIVIQDYALEIDDLLGALDRAAGHVDAKTRPLDRHIAAFVAARADTSVDEFLKAINAKDAGTSTLGMLSLLALLQWNQDSGPVYGLASWVGGLLAPAINSYHSRTTRRAIEREMPRYIRQGNLTQIYNFIENKERRRLDADGFNAAAAQCRAAEAEIGRIEGSDTAHAETAEEIGQQTAAIVAVMLTLVVMTVIFIFHQY